MKDNNSRLAFGGKRGPGQPSGYRAEYVDQVRRLCEAGLTDVQIAQYFGVDRKTIRNWQIAHPEFHEARQLKHELARIGPVMQRRRLLSQAKAAMVQAAKARAG